MNCSVLWIFAALAAPLAWAQSSSGEDAQLDREIAAIAQAHHGRVALFAENLKTGETASYQPDLPVQTASTIKLGILLDAAEQLRDGRATLDEKLVLSRDNQVEGSGVLSQLDTPLALTLKDALTLMVILSDNTATNMAIDRLGLEPINRTLRAAGLKQTVLYKKVFLPPPPHMPADQPKFGLGKTTPREIASIMERFADCRLKLEGPNPPNPTRDTTICAAMLHMLRNQQDRNSLPRYLQTMDTSEHGSAIANKAGALNQVRNDVALIAGKNGPIVIAAFTQDNADQRWTPENEGELTLARLGQAIVRRWSPGGLDAESFPWDRPGPAGHAAP
ncbi:MAG TPA: serine hydrolase [Terracidiphilus sp.]|jgi:beta-lactamase class A|nr:serine hydrolase [Terracidiphilus sp.]